MSRVNTIYATLFTDITTYDHQYIRDVILDLHWGAYFAVAEDSEMSEEDRLAAISALHDARVSAPKNGEPEEKRVYLWPKGQVPSVTEYMENPGYTYNDAPDFEPFMLESLVEEGSQVKGAMLIAAGGGRNFRSNVEEGIEVAQAFNALGYQCFIVNYRISPYTLEESALDVARAVRIVRTNADKYGIDEDKIAAAGFSAGGSTITAALCSFYGDKNADSFITDYVPDELDAASADINVYLSIYGNYDTDSLPKENIPPMFFVIGGNDGWEDVTKCFDAIRDAGVKAEVHTFAGAPHGFGAGTDAAGVVYTNAATWPLLADSFMQDVYAAQ